MASMRLRRGGDPERGPARRTASRPAPAAATKLENRPDLLQAQEQECPPVLMALAECFGDRALDVDLCTDDAALADLGADAATRGSQVVLPGGVDLDSPSRDDLDTLGHEVAHALGSSSGEHDVDREGDAGEAQAHDAGARFAAWVAGGQRGAAPELSAATGGQAEVHRKHASTELTGNPMLSNGSRGRHVVLAQQLLNDHGARLRVDGIFGPATERAVRRFQGRNGLKVDGIVGPRTAGALEAAHRHVEPEVELEETGDFEPPTLSGRPMLRKGDKGPKVRVLQDLLSTAGFRLAVDGDFGPVTDRAVRAYQRSRGLTVDGIVGPQTAAALSRNASATERDDKGPEETEERRSFDPGGRLADSRMNPKVVALTEKLCLELQKRGFHPYVTDGFRSFAEQDGLYEKGRSKPGPKVTWVKGGGSWHNYGLAVDIAFWNGSGSGPSWSGHHPWHLIGEVGKAVGFTRWGGSFGDRPHLEHHPAWGNKATDLASTYRDRGLSEVWKRVGA